MSPPATVRQTGETRGSPRGEALKSGADKRSRPGSHKAPGQSSGRKRNVGGDALKPRHPVRDGMAFFSGTGPA